MLQGLSILTHRTQDQMPAPKCLFSSVLKSEPGTRVCVIVPVRNEAKFLVKTLDSLRKQFDDKGRSLDPAIFEVLILVNNSTDNSYQIATSYANRFPDFRLVVQNVHLPENIAHIGTVRRMLMDGAYERMMSSGNDNGIIASTDGDTVVDKHWVYHIITEIEKGNDAVGGRILTEKNAGRARLYHLRDVTYRCLLSQAESLIDPQVHDPFPCHFQYFGANMAVTCKMYNQAGRLPQLPFLEDMAFHKALLLQDARIRKSFDVKVYTSARMNGRVPIGFSEQLKKWNEEDKSNKQQMVEKVDYLLNTYKLRSWLRKCWKNYADTQIFHRNEIDSIAILLHVNSSWLSEQLINAVYFGKLWDIVNQNSNFLKTITYQPVDQAIENLRLFLRETRTTAFQTNRGDTFLYAG